MSDTTEKISKILADPESIKIISELAESIMSGNERPNDENEILKEEVKSSEEQSIQADTVELKALTALSEGIGNIVSKTEPDNTVRLITALKPYMSSQRKESADSILKMLNLLKIAKNVDLKELSSILGLLGK